MSEFGFETNPDTMLAPFGLTDGFIESLTPEDLRGVLSAIAKYAAISRHPDRFGSSRVDYSFGNTDARTLTAIAGRFSQLSDEEVAEVQEAYTDDAVMKEYRDHVINLSKTIEDQQKELRVVKKRGLELLIPDEGGETINDFTGMLFSRRGILTPNITAIDVEKGSKVKSVLEVPLVDKEFVKDADMWVQDAYRVARTAADNENHGSIFIVSTAEGARLRASGKTIDLISAGVEVPPPNSNRRANVPQLYLITSSINKKTGKIDKPVIVTYSQVGKKFYIPTNTHILGFMDSKFYDFPPEKVENISESLPKLMAAQMSTEKISKIFSRVSIDTFWSLIIADKQAFSRSLEASSEFVPILYDPSSSNDECFALGSYYMAVRK